MVKNTFGGNKHKGQARKNVNSKPSNRLRLSQCEGEVYAIVTKMNGNCMFNAHGIDGVSRLGLIRGKFSGRGKRDNIVSVGKWVLLGDREWDTKRDGKSQLKSDLLEVYNDSEKERLINSVNVDWSVLTSNDLSKHTPDETDDTIKFGHEENSHSHMEEKEESTKPVVVDTIVLDSAEEEAFDIDDI